MKRILGLDLGVGSIGWALVNEAEIQGEESSIVKLGVRVNPLTVDEQNNFEKGKSITTNADRTLKRGMRRSLQRYKLRRNALVDKLKETGLISNETPLYEQGNRTTFETYRLRAKAATEEISLEEFARVLLMINKKRGYKSNRKAKGGEEGTLVDGMEVAKKLYDEHITPGQYSLTLVTQGKKYLPEYYQSDLREELRRIWDTQKPYYPEILTDDFWNTLQGKSGSQTNKIFIARYQVFSPTLKRDEKRRQLLLWRVEGLTKRLSIDIVSAVVSELNGQINGTSGYLGKISDRSKELFFNHQTVGQYLMNMLDTDPNVSLKNLVFYRQDYLDEFNQLWETQAKYHPELTQELKHDIGSINIFYQRPLKSQKDLVSICELEQQKKEVTIDGKVKTITIGSKVCPKSSPLFQEFRIWQRLNDLKVLDNENHTSRYLAQEEKEILANELSIRGRMTKQQILKVLFGKVKNLDLNFKEIEGNETQATLFSAYQQIIDMSGHGEHDFSKMTANEIRDLVSSVFTALGFRTDMLSFDAILPDKAFEQQPLYRIWHLLYSYESDNSVTGDASLIAKLRELYGFGNDEYAKLIAQISFKPDYGSLSAKAIRKILPYMMEGNEYSLACEYAGYRHSARSLTKEEIAKKVLKERLDLLPRNSLRNPVVEKILNQMINVVNEIVDTYGKIDEIRIELARDLKRSAKDREEATNAINQTAKLHEEYRKLLHDEFHIEHPTRNDILRYKLYMELAPNGFKTLYSNTPIIRERLFSRDYDIEHIIPQASLFDDSYSNKTLELRDINLEKANTTAMDFVTTKYGEEGAKDYKARIDDLLRNKKISQAKHDKLLMTGNEIPKDFIERDLRDSQYIARKAREILEDIVRVVNSTTGTITDRLREDWGLIDVMKELNWDKYETVGQIVSWVNRDGITVRHIKDWTKRNDHRHHAMDALTIAFTKHCIVQYYNNMNARADKTSDIYGIECKEMERYNGKLRFKVPVVGLREEAKRHLQQILVSIKSKSKVVTQNVNKSRAKHAPNGITRRIQLTPRGQLHNETIYGSQQHYKTTEEKVNAAFTVEKITMVAKREYREALLRRLKEFGGDPKKAFTGKNTLEKNPIWLDRNHTHAVPLRVKCVTFETLYTIRRPVDKDLKLEKVVDPKIRAILQKRLDAYGGDAVKAFANLDENPIWLNEERGIAIKRVTINAGLSAPEPIHEQRNRAGKHIMDEEGKRNPVDFVQTSNNHHVAIFQDADGNLQEHIVSFYEAVTRANQGLPVIDHDYHREDGWQFLFTMKQNEYFVFPDEGFNPAEVDLMNQENYALISPHLYRVQKFSTKDYSFRHHLETNVNDVKELRGITWKRITNCNALRGIIKVCVNHIGQIVAVGEY